MLLFLTVCEMDEIGGYCGGASREEKWLISGEGRCSSQLKRVALGMQPHTKRNSEPRSATQNGEIGGDIRL
jgi:hypothetical protein